MAEPERRKLSTDPYKGVRDFYPEDQQLQNYLFATIRDVVERFGYVEYGASILEPSELYKTKGAENEEMVSEQTYTFTDRGGREVTLRPEMTPTVARMVAARRRELGFPLRLYSIPNLFRYERTQRGRLREHYQLNVDLFGSASRYAEAEVIAVAHGILKALGGTEKDFMVKINSRSALNALFARYGLGEAQQKELRNLIDRKNKIDDFETQAERIVGWPFSFSDSEPEDVRLLRGTLADLGIANTEYDPSIVRGFEYYTGIVFEVFDTHEKNNRSMLGGGRYDNLLEMFGTEKIPVVGFGMGDVTMRDFLEVRGLLPAYSPATRLYIGSVGETMIPFAMKLADELRSQGVAVAVNLTERKAGDQIKVADKHGIPFVLFVGPKELESGQFTVRDIKSGAETALSRKELDSFFVNLR